MTQDKYNPTKYGKAIGCRFPEKDPITGLYLLHSNGCHRHPNCFTCFLPDCQWNDKSDKWRGENEMVNR